MADLPNDTNALRRVVNAVNGAGGAKRNSLRSTIDALLAPAQNVAGFAADPQSWQDMGRNLLGMVGSPLPNQQEAAAMMQRRRMQGSVMRDYPSAETDLANSYRDKMQAVALGMNPVLQTVWHGSPHKFDAFDMSKIGTGEGAQAYGHGLYFAESPEVAKAYAGANKGHAAAKDGWIDSLPKHMQMDVYKILQKDLPDVMRTPMLEDIRPRIGEDVYREVKNRIASSNLYKVDLPDDQIARMLDWDKPLSQQPEVVQTWAMKQIQKPGDPYNLQRYFSPKNPNGGPLGQDLYRAIEGLGNQSAVSDALRQAGIPGIRYLDGGSRGARQGTSNFVVFDDRIPKILGRE